MPKKFRRKKLKKVIKDLLKKFKLHIICISILLIIIQISRFFPAKILGKIIDLYPNAKDNIQTIINYFILFGGIVICDAILRIFWLYFRKKLLFSFEKKLKDTIFSRFLALKTIGLQKTKNGELMSYLSKYTNDITRGFASFINDFIRTVVVLIILSTFMFQINLKLTLLVYIPMIIDTIIIFILKEIIKNKQERAQKSYTKLSEFVQESTDSIRITKAFNGEARNIAEFTEKSETLKTANVTVYVYTSLLYISILTCFGICYGISAIYGAKLVVANAITVGEFIVFNDFINEMFWPLVWIPRLITNMKNAQSAVSKLDKFYKLPIESLTETKQTINGDIDIKCLSFKHVDNKEALKNININLKQGQTLGIIGTIGSGKTTIANILLKLYDIEDNKVFVNGKDINQINTYELRDSFCYITQESFLFSDTIKNNITLFNDRFTDEQILESVKYACLEEDVNNMENGIETLIGEKGVTLSGGQRQRVAIARAFLYNQDLIIFDDSFSAIDNKTEKIILKNIKEVLKDKTCIIISNRISDVNFADNIIVLDEGQIVQEGKHEELITQDGLYRHFYNQQSLMSVS